jgi:hypothetical protein
VYVRDHLCAQTGVPTIALLACVLNTELVVEGKERSESSKPERRCACASVSRVSAA